MGSKEKVLGLIDHILNREYKKEYFIDLFAGGLSVSNYALRTSKLNVIANDINKYVISLYEELLNGGKNFEQVKYTWISRARFIEVRDKPEKYPEWFVGYVLNVWSFGCNQKDYLYAKDLEENKKAIHKAIVDCDYSLMKNNEIFKGFESLYEKEDLDYKKFPLKRLTFMEQFKKIIYLKNGEKIYKELLRLEQLESLNQMEHLTAITDSTQFKERIKFYKMDWKELLNNIPPEILEKSIIYCDPPYQDTKQYQFGKDFNYEEFWKWFRESPYSIYVSSYKAPKDILPLTFELKTQLLDNGHRGDNKKKKVATENVYWNGKGDVEETFQDILFGNKKAG